MSRKTVTAEELRKTIAVAVAMIPPKLRKAYAQPAGDTKQQEAQKAIADYLVEQIGVFLIARENPLPPNSTGRFARDE